MAPFRSESEKIVYRDQIELPVRTPVYPEELEQWMKLKDKSSLFLRPLRLTDEPLLRAMFYKLSTESVHSRFFRMIKTMPHEKLQEFLRIDYEADMAMVTLTGSGEGAEVVGISHYSKDTRTNFADAAFLVRDDWQGKGIGTAMINALADVARNHGIAGFTADVLNSNHGMLRAYHKCGYPIKSELVEGIVPAQNLFYKKEKEK